MSRRCRWRARQDEGGDRIASSFRATHRSPSLLKAGLFGFPRTQPVAPQWQAALAALTMPALLATLAILAMSPGQASARSGAASGWAEMQGAHVVSGGTVDVAVSRELAFQVLTDYDRMADFLPGMVASEVVSRRGNHVVVEQSADEGVFLFRQRVEVRLAIEELPPSRLSIRALAGSFKELEASYVLTRTREVTRIEYRARFIPGFDVPPVLGLYAIQHSLERHLGALAGEMRRRAAAAAGPAPQPAGQIPAPAQGAPIRPRGD